MHQEAKKTPPSKRATEEKKRRLKRKPGPKALTGPSKGEEDFSQAKLLMKMVKSKEVECAKTKAHKVEYTPQERLTPEQEVQLTLQAHLTGDLDARNQLVASNMGLVHMIAHQYFRPTLRYEDLVQEGTLGLIRATETFEPERSLRFSTYSVYWIRARVQRWIFRAEKDEMPDYIDDATANKKGSVSKKGRRVSFDARISGEDSSRTVSETIAAQQKDPEGHLIARERKAILREAIFGVSKEMKDERTKIVILRRLLADAPESLAEVGKQIGLSREGVRLMEQRIVQATKKRLKKLLQP